MAFTCEDCLDPMDEWSKHKFFRRMGLSHGRCECCLRVRDCVNTPHSHKGPCPWRKDAHPAEKLAAGWEKVKEEAQEVVEEAEVLMGHEPTRKQLVEALTEAVNRLVKYVDPNYDLFDEFPFAIKLLVEDTDRSDIQHFMVESMDNWEWCQRCQRAGYIGWNGLGSEKVYCRFCHGKGIVEHELKQLARVAEEEP